MQNRQIARGPHRRCFAIAGETPVDRLYQLLARTAEGDRAAFHALYASTSAKLFGIIRQIVANHAEAEDVLQDAYVRVWERASTYDAARGRPMTWLITIARHGAIDRIRKKTGRIMVELDQVVELRDDLPTPDVAVFASRDAQRLTAVLEKLPSHVAATIRSAYIEGLSYEELATQSGVAVGTMKSRVRRGLLKMRADLSSGAATRG